MAEVALLLSIVALVVAMAALGIAGSAARAIRWPQPSVLRPPADYPVPADPGSFSGEVMAHLARGDKIGAIKQYRIETGLGLKEAKDAIDALDRGER